MQQRPKVLFVIADGAHARLIARSPDNGDFVVVQSLDGDDRLETARREVRSQPSGRSFESAATARHAVGKDDPYFEAKIAFVDAVGEAAIAAAEHGIYEGLGVIAPAKLLKTLRGRIETKTRVVGTIARDLTKIPTHELGRWLEPLEREADWTNAPGI